MRNVTLKYLKELEDNEIKWQASKKTSGLINLEKAKDILQRFEVELRNEWERLRLMDDRYNDEIKHI